MARGAIQLSGPGLKKLRVLQRRLDDITGVKRAIAAVQAEEGIDLTKQAFVKETDPYGKRWKKRKRETKQTRGRKVLSGKTSRLKGGWHVSRVSADGWQMSSSVDYALPHQRPKRGRRPQRAMVPLTGRFPKRWKRPMNDAASDAITDFLVGK